MKRCYSCKSWIPHFHHDFIGFCVEKEELVFEDNICTSFEVKKLDKELIWCSACKCEISAEEVEHHKSKGHRLFLAVFLDKEYREEIYEG
ncbi:MAG: hypothetical protein ACK401_05095 [Archaeoglobaceae archaeon]